MADPEPYEIYAVKYAHNHRTAAQNFIGGDPHDCPMPLDYYVWAITNENRTIILDTGFDEVMAAKRGRDHIRCPGDGLKMIGIEPTSVEHVIISHMHYDHSGNEHLFPKARYHLQEDEMTICTGRHMCHEHMTTPFSVADVVAMVRRVFSGRVQFHDGAEEIAPGITVHRVGGHTMGLQATRVMTKRGWVVLASDASHFYANMEQKRPFPIVYDMGEILSGYETVKHLAASPAHVIPGHDPLVLERYDAPKAGLQGIVARLDIAPKC